MNEEEYRAHMTLWCILAAPLFAGNDLTKMSPATLELLTNPEVIAVDQDAAGIQGHRAWQEGPTEIWLKPLADKSKAIAVFNCDANPMSVTVNFKDLGLPQHLKARDLWQHQDLGILHQSVTFSLPRHGAVMLKTKPAP